MKKRMTKKQLIKENMKLFRKHKLKRINVESWFRPETPYPVGWWLRTQMSRDELEENLRHKNDPNWWKGNIAI